MQPRSAPQPARWNPRFLDCAPELATLARAAAPFVGRPDWPAPEELSPAFAAAGIALPVEFEAAHNPMRKLGPEERYDARIALERRVPTRPRSWHDFVNALVWAAFPEAKLALHLRQHRMLRGRARTREGDTLALVDEGSVLSLDGQRVLFGHALYEHFIVGGGRLVARVVELGEGGAELVRSADEKLAALLRDTRIFQHPDELGHVQLRD